MLTLSRQAALPKRLLLACVAAVVMMTASLVSNTPSAEAHATCTIGYHTDWHTFYFHTDYHNFYRKDFVRQEYGLNGLLYNRWTYWYRNSPHGQFYSTSCKWLVPGQ